MINEPGFVFSFSLFLDFLKKFKWRLFMFAFLSLAIIALGVGIIYFLIPAPSFMSQKIEILLIKENKGETRIYPSGKKFNRLDIVSPSVLRAVYESNQLEKIFSYEDFQKSVSVVNFSIERALLDAEVASKLSKRNLTVTDVKTIEAEYQSALDKIDSSVYRVIFTDSSVPPHLSAKIVNDIILNWFRIYSMLESDNLPAVTLDSQIEAIINQELKSSRFIALDRLYYYMRQLERLSERLYALQSDRKLTVSSGESLEDIIASMHYVMTYQLSLLRQMIMTDAGLRSPLDLMYIQSRLEHEQRQLNTLKTQHKMLLESLAIMEKKGVAESSGTTRDAESSLVLDSGVLNQLSVIFARDASNDFRIMLAEQNLALAQSIAKQEASVAFYQEISDKLNDASGKAAFDSGKIEFDRLFRHVLTKAVELGRATTEFKGLLTNEYLSFHKFYAPVGEATWERDSLISRKRLGAGTVVVWLLLNVIYSGVLFSCHIARKQDDLSGHKEGI